MTADSIDLLAYAGFQELSGCVALSAVVLNVVIPARMRVSLRHVVWVRELLGTDNALGAEAYGEA